MIDSCGFYSVLIFINSKICVFELQREEPEVKVEPSQESEPTIRRRDEYPPNLAEFSRMVAENEFTAAAAAVAADSREYYAREIATLTF